jgi:DNA polymerase
MKKIVLGHGNKHAKIMLIGEAPGRQEIRQGRPFVGLAGKWLDKILKKNKIDRNKLYITNLIKVKLPNNRKPAEKEIKKWLPILKKEIKTIKPKIIVLLGDQVTQAFFHEPIKKIRGQLIKSEKTSYLATYHPSAARFTNVKNKISKDFAKLKKYF